MSTALEAKYEAMSKGDLVELLESKIVRDKYETMSKEGLVELLIEIHTNLQYAESWDVALSICELLNINVSS